MAKLVHTDIVNINGAETVALAAINANGAASEAALENTLSLDGTSPNSMGADFDLNSNDIINAGAVSFADGSSIITSTAASTITVLTQAAYDALGTYDATTIYLTT